MTGIGYSLLLIGSTLAAAEPPASWPQFRGPNGSGVVRGASHALPARIGPDQNVLWKTPIPAGHSSPIVHGDRVYLTAPGEKGLLTIALNRHTGTIVWQAEAPRRQRETIHAVGNHAQATPATDGTVVVSVFGESGLHAYDLEGKPLWQFQFGPVDNEFGVGSSPIIVGSRVILNQDHDTGAYLVALDKKTGRVVWKTERPEFQRGYATPVVWEVERKKQLVVAGTLRVVGYDLESGNELWTVRGLARIINTTPVIGPDNVLYVSSWAPGGAGPDRIVFPPWTEILAAHDANKNGTLEAGEAPAGPIKERFNQIDRDKDGHLSRDEYESARQRFDASKDRLVAIKPGGKGDVTQTHVLWEQTKQLPYCPSPVLYEGTLYLIRDGGMLSSIDARTGKAIKQERIGATGRYFSSPIVGDGKLYVLSEKGALTVLTANPDWKKLDSAQFNDEAGYATPAIVDGRIYLRTSKYLYCFGKPAGQ